MPMRLQIIIEIASYLAMTYCLSVCKGILKSPNVVATACRISFGGVAGRSPSDLFIRVGNLCKSYISNFNS